MKSARHKARELALQGLYQWLLAQEHAREIRTHLAELKGYDQADQEYLERLINGVIADAAELEAAFGPVLDRAVDELSPVERAVLLLGAYELAHVPEVPYRVVINEAVELAKSYGGTVPSTVTEMLRGPRVVSPPINSTPKASASLKNPWVN